MWQLVGFNCESGTLPCCELPDSSNLVEMDGLGVASSTGPMDEIIICSGNLFVRVVCLY